ncbi:FK506-binding protein-like [Myripristis murdjan]|uniref:FKBP prolyl isomerase like n=1 Tax=Myripristis murdjan TaxID=586833 RepID=A0A667XUZ6_9TELE|nr:FK506-binding protein-like [Myripristis murdjan]
MDPVHRSETQDSGGDGDRFDVTSWVSVCPRGLWKVQRRRTHKRGQQTTYNPEDDRSWLSSAYPRLGSLCRVRVCLKANLDETGCPVSDEGDEKLSIGSDQPITELTEVPARAFQRCQGSVLQVPLDDWTMLRLGEGQCDITEACVEGMRAEEQCEILLSPLENGPEGSVPQPTGDNQPLCATVELHSFTPGKESWQMSPGEKWEWVRLHKERGGERFRNGDVWGASDSYSRALKLLITLHSCISEVERNGPGQKMEEQKDTNTCDKQKLAADSLVPSIKAELHSNLSLCQLKLNQPQRAKASAAKATQLDPTGAKAWYRLGQAYQMVNDLEEARRAFGRLLELQPDSPAAQKALKDVASREKEKNTQLGLRLSKMFS